MAQRLSPLVFRYLRNVKRIKSVSENVMFRVSNLGDCTAPTPSPIDGVLIAIINSSGGFEQNGLMLVF